MQDQSLSRSNEIYAEQQLSLAVRTDRLFVVLLLLEWVIGVVFSLVLSPKTWVAEQSSIHIHVLAAVLLGGLLTSFPVFLVWQQPGRALNRYAIALAQMSYSALFIDLTGGRIETHFHIFGSLAFLAIYRDRRVLVIATVTTMLDHFFRGFVSPLSIYGVNEILWWRGFEHAGWIAFENIFLCFSIRNAKEQAHLIADHQAQLEEIVRRRTEELAQAQALVLNQQKSLIESAKNSALGEMAGQVAHEINTPLAAIVLTAQGLQKKATKNLVASEEVTAKMEFILQITHKLSRIINSMRKLAGHGGASESIKELPIRTLVDDVLLLCEGRFRKNGIDFRLEDFTIEGTTIQCRPNELSQVLINLLNNAYDAVSVSPGEKWICLNIQAPHGKAVFRVTDCGPGIEPSIANQLFTPKFSTKTLDHGTGFGLFISKRLVERGGGRIYLDSADKNTSFVFEVPLEQVESIARAAGGD